MNLPAKLYHDAQTESLAKTLITDHVYLTRCEAFNEVATQLTRSIKGVANAWNMHSPPGYRLLAQFTVQLSH